MTKFCISCVLGNFAVIQKYLWLHKNGKGLTVLWSPKTTPGGWLLRPSHVQGQVTIPFQKRGFEGICGFQTPNL